jgi:alpha-glucosidase (family GH31 glycosyl hydrolase)
MRAAMQFRARLTPYLYTSARRAYDTGVSMVSPMYYYWPHHEEAYSIKTQYMLGDDMLVVPVVKGMAVNMSVVTGVSVWAPPGEWVDWHTGQVVHGPTSFNRSFTIKEMGMYIRSGAIIVNKVGC